MERKQDIKTRVCLLDMGQRVTVDLNHWIFSCGMVGEVLCHLVEGSHGSERVSPMPHQ